MQILAAVLDGPKRPFVVQPLELAPPKRGEVLVRVKAVGICHSDWHLVTGATRHPFPCVAGHEGSGIVEDVGDGVSQVHAGDHVALNWAPSCGECFFCKAGRPALCGAYVGPIWAGTMLDGTTRLKRGGEPVYHYCSLACHAQFAVVPEVCCVPMPKEVPFEVAALIGCAAATGVGAVLNTAKIPNGASLAVFGCGGVGLSAILGAKLVGASPIIAVDSNPSKAGLAESLGATDFVLGDTAVRERILALTEGRGADFAIEAVGSRSVQELAFDCVRSGGTLVIAGLSPMGEDSSFPAARLVREEKAVLGSYYGTCDARRDFPSYAALFLAGKLPLDRLVSETYPLAEINAAYGAMSAGKAARGVILVD